MSSARLAVAALAAVALALSALSYAPAATPARGHRSAGPFPPAAGPRADHVPRSAGRAHAALCLAVKNQTDDLLEWVAWHHHLARVDRIYILENVDGWPEPGAPEPRVARLLEAYIDAGVVEHLPYVFAEASRSRFPHHQAFVYASCFEVFGPRHEWIVAIDADEFIEFPGIGNGTSLSDVLRTYERPGVGELLLYWRTFGNPGGAVRTRQPAGSIATFVGCFPADHKTNLHPKTAGRPRGVQALDVHMGLVREGYHAVDERGDPVVGSLDLSRGPPNQRIWVNHYASRSRQENAEKTLRTGGQGGGKPPEHFAMIDAAATERCESARDAWLRSGVWEGAPEWAARIL